MKYYLKNLFLALTGNNPFQIELKETKQQLEKAAENMSAMQDMYYKALENWTQAIKTLEASEKRCGSLQQLTENLRERIADKDRMIAKLEKELNKR